MTGDVVNVGVSEVGDEEDASPAKKRGEKRKRRGKRGGGDDHDDDEGALGTCFACGLNAERTR